HRVGWELPSFRHFHPGWTLVPAAVGGGLVVSLMAKWAPVIRGHGIPEAMEAVLTKQSRIQPRGAIAKPLSAAVARGTWGPCGAEGPIIVTGGAIGSLLGQVLPVSPAERKILLASGAAAGMAATFGTPLAAVVLAIELLLFEFSTRAFIPLVVASALAGGVHSAIFGSGPLFAVPHHSYAGLDRLGLYAALLALAVAKLAAWWVALASGTSGGTLAPVLLISGSFGSLFGTLVSRIFPSAHISPGAFALVAMASTFGAATRATFASIVFLF